MTTGLSSLSIGFLKFFQMTKTTRATNKVQATANSAAIVERKYRRGALVYILFMVIDDYDICLSSSPMKMLLRVGAIAS